MSNSRDENALSTLKGDEGFTNASTLEQGSQRPQNVIQPEAVEKEILNASANTTDPRVNPAPNSETADSDLENPFKQECALNSPIWQLYQDKARSVDEHLKESHNSGLDSLLIFAGLFSAVLSAFIIEARHGLQADSQTTTNALLLALLQSQSGSASTYDPPPFESSLSIKFVNGLWFCSLSFSLLSALGASLAKSWVADYAQVQHKPNAEDAYRRHLRFLGISSWHLTDVITSLPILLHVAYFLFAFGLAILLFGDSAPIGAITLILTVMALILYLGTAMVPLFYPDCPYQTPVTTFLIRLVGWLFESEKIITSFSDLYKAQLLLWLHDISLGSTEMDKIIMAIAGLDSSPNVQNVLHNSQLARTLCHSLSTINLQSANPQSLRAYLSTILNLLRTGFPHIGDPDEQTTKDLLIQLVATAGPLDDFNNLPLGIKELATCIKARILLRYQYDSKHEIFEITIPLLLKSMPPKALQEMLREVYLLGQDGNRELLPQLHSGEQSSRRNAYNRMRYISKQRNDIDIGYALIIDEIYSSISPTFIKYLNALTHILKKYPHAGNALLSEMDLEKITRRLDDPSPIVRDAIAQFMKSITATDLNVKVISMGCILDLLSKLRHLDGNVRKAAHNCIDTILIPDDARRNFISSGGIQKLIELFQDTECHARRSSLDCIRTLCLHDDIRTSFIMSDGIQKLFEKLQDLDWDVQVLALDWMKALCVHENVRLSFISGFGMQRLFEKLDESGRNVCLSALDCIGTLCVNDDIRMAFISCGGMQKVLEKLQDSNQDVQKSALNCIKALCLHGDIRVCFISGEGVQKVFEGLQRCNRDVQMLALNCIKSLCVHDDVRKNLMSTIGMQRLFDDLQNPNWSDYIKTFCLNGQVFHPFYLLVPEKCTDNIRMSFILSDGVKKVIEKLQHSVSIERRLALECIEALCVYENARKSFLLNDGMLKLLETLQDPDWHVQWSAFSCVTSLFVKDDFRSTFILNGGIQKLLNLHQFQKLNWHWAISEVALKCVKTACVHDDIRMAFITNQGMQKILEHFHDLESEVRMSALHWVNALCVHEDLGTSFIAIDGLQRVVDKLEDWGDYVQEAALDCVETLSVHETFEAIFVLDNRMQKVLDRCHDYENIVRSEALYCISTLCVNENLRMNFMSIGGAQIVVDKLQDSSWDADAQRSALNCVKNLSVHDDIRMDFIANDILQKVIENFQDSNEILQNLALDCVKNLCLHDDIRTNFILNDSTHKVIKNLKVSSQDVRKFALDCIKTLCLHADIAMNLILGDGLPKVLEKLQDSELSPRKAALECLKVLCSHDHILRMICLLPSVSTVTQILKSPDSDSETQSYLASILVPSLVLNENTRLVQDTLNTVSHLLLTPHTSPYGLLILELLSKQYS